MSAPDLAAILENLPDIKEKIDELFARLDTVVPGVLSEDEAAIKAALGSALAGLDLASIKSSLASAMEVIRHGEGIIGPGVDATLA